MMASPVVLAGHPLRVRMDSDKGTVLVKTFTQTLAELVSRAMFRFKHVQNVDRLLPFSPLVRGGLFSWESSAGTESPPGLCSQCRQTASQRGADMDWSSPSLFLYSLDKGSSVYFDRMDMLLIPP
jgi:hypothetical protein